MNRPITATDVRVGHHSLKYNGSVAALSTWCARFVTSFRLDLATFTECKLKGSKPDTLRAVLAHQLGPDFWVIRRGEYITVVRKSTFARDTDWRNRHGVQALASKLAYFMLGKIGRKFAYAEEHLTLTALARPWLAVNFHAPSGIDGGRGWRRVSRLLRTRQTSARDGFPRLGKRVRAWIRKHPEGVATANGDTNLDLRAGRWRTYLNRKLGGRGLWSVKHSTRGSHGHRLIDSAQIYGPRVVIRSARVLAASGRPRQLDHRPVLYVLRVHR